jgi:hypothetical protein
MHKIRIRSKDWLEMSQDSVSEYLLIKLSMLVFYKTVIIIIIVLSKFSVIDVAEQLFSKFNEHKR